MKPWVHRDRLRDIEAKLDILLESKEFILASIADLKSAVANEASVEQGVITLLQTLSADLQAAIANNDPVAMQAVVDQINNNSAALADAVKANTPG